MKELQKLVAHASECRNSQCDVMDFQKVMEQLNQISSSKVREMGNSRVCEACTAPACMERRENLRNAKDPVLSESSNNEDAGKPRKGLARDAIADPNASSRRQEMFRQVESSLGSESTISNQKLKQQVDSVSSKSEVSTKLMEKPIGSRSCSGLGSCSGSVPIRSARQLRMKLRAIEGSRKNRSPIQNKKQYEYTDQDKSIMLGITAAIMHELFKNAKK